ncbi:MAG: type II toxin-antitoxin system RelE/ParE family toxin [Actinomycetia bacterium]|nr:type II toxin-antitoxin system RelE/ParE family toxin [Actinomycetes bacterium]
MHADLRTVAAADIDSAITYYRNEAGPEVAVSFVDELEAAIAHLLQHPLMGSLRFSYELEIPGLRSWPVQKFPYLIFFVPGDERIDIWRVLHALPDIPTFPTPDPPD